MASCTAPVSATRAACWQWLDENWRRYVVRPADLPRADIRSKVEHGSGLYFLWTPDGALRYVGVTGDYRTRLTQHRRRGGISHWSGLWLRTGAGLQRAGEHLEHCYIVALAPPDNRPTRLKPWPGAADMITAIRAR